MIKPYWITNKFTANVAITMYKKGDLKEQTGKIKKGEKFKVYKVKLNKSDEIIAVYVKVSKDRKGWINVNTGYNHWDDNALVTDPLLWG